MEAVARELVGRDVCAHGARLGRVRDERRDELTEVLMRARDVSAAMKECAQVVVAVLERDERVCAEHGREPCARITRPMSDRRELAEVGVHTLRVPRDEDRLDVGEVLVERRAPDPRFIGDLRHRDGGQPFASDERQRLFDDGGADREAVRFDGLVPELGHSVNDTQ